MLWFYGRQRTYVNVLQVFQYISCYGSTARIKIRECNSIISIHLMLWFYISGKRLNTRKTKFQYISCYGSTCCLCPNRLSKQNFNTSHVMVLPGRKSTKAYIHRFQYISCYGSTRSPSICL